MPKETVFWGLLFSAVYGIRAVREEEGTPAASRKAILSGVDDTPLEMVAKIPEGRENDAEVASALSGGRFEETVDILEEYERWLLFL